MIGIGIGIGGWMKGVVVVVVLIVVLGSERSRAVRRPNLVNLATLFLALPRGAGVSYALASCQIDEVEGGHEHRAGTLVLFLPLNDTGLALHHQLEDRVRSRRGIVHIRTGHGAFGNAPLHGADDGVEVGDYQFVRLGTRVQEH